MLITVLVITIFILSLSITGIITEDRSVRPPLSRHVFYYMSLYATVLIGFALLYLVLTLNGISVILALEEGDSYLSLLTDSLYASAMTLFTVGYGDFVPTGIGKWMAIIEAFIGYLIPTSFVIRVIHNEAHRSY